ncbi:MAG: DUF285 domain-containing protein [Clostridia bacterium]|nr:DUF285 domain-containing protein [Clostridia bacterium]
MSKTNRIYKIFMTTMIVAIAGMLLAMGIIAAQKTMKLGVRFPSNPNYRLEIWIQKTGEDAQPVFCNFEDEGLNKQVEMQNGITSLDGNTISADNSFFTKYGNDFTLIIKNYTESTGIEVSMTSTATMLQGGNGIPAQIEAEKTAASKFENEQSLDSVSFRVYVNSVFPQTTSLKIIISELNSYSVTVDSTTNNFNFDGATKNEIGADYTAILKAHTGYNLSITVKQGGVTLTAGQDYTWDAGTGQLRIPSVTGNIEITCVAILAQGTITFNWNNDVDGLAVTYKSTTPPSEMTYTSGETKVLNDNDITKVGCEFLGWTYPGQTEPQKNLDLGTLSGDLEITANWGATLVKGGNYNLSSFGYLVYSNFVSEVNLAVERPTLGNIYNSLLKSITFGYWEDYKDFVLVDTYNNTENTIAYGIPIDVNGEGSIRLFGNGTKAYILSPNKIFANENLDKLFESSVVVNSGSNGVPLTYTHEINELIFDNFDTSKVTNTSYMFYDCSDLTSLDLSSFNTANVTDMSYMFYGCSGLTSLDLSNFNTANVTGMRSMFQNCDRLTSLDLSSFNTSKVTDMSYMFNSCSNLTKIYVGDLWSTGAVTTSNSMFSACTKLVGGNGTSYATVGVTDASYARIDEPGTPGYLTLKT